MKDKKIETETVILLNLLYGVLITPYNLVQYFRGKSSWSEVMKPYKLFVRELFRPVFTTSMIFILIIAYIISLFLPQILYDLLVFYPVDILSINSYTLLTHGFLHANLMHLFGNVLILFIFGRIVEKQFGAIKTGLVYFTALFIAAFFHGLISLFFLGTNAGAVGASGAIMGLVSAGILLRPFTISYGLLVPLPVFLIGWLAIGADITGILQGMDDNIGRFAHIGGFFSVFVLIPFFSDETKQKIWRGLKLNVVTLIAFVVVNFILMLF